MLDFLRTGWSVVMVDLFVSIYDTCKSSRSPWSRGLVLQRNRVVVKQNGFWPHAEFLCNPFGQHCIGQSRPMMVEEVSRWQMAAVRCVHQGWEWFLTLSQAHKYNRIIRLEVKENNESLYLYIATSLESRRGTQPNHGGKRSRVDTAKEWLNLF